LVHASPVSHEEDTMVDKPTDEGSFPRDRYADSETALGGADAVEKTTYVTGKGAEPDAQRAEPPAARVSSGARIGTTWIIVAFFVIAAILVYLLGFGR
jgi:hypothetical protein